MSRSKRIALVLGSIAGVLAVVALLQQLGIGSGYSLLENERGKGPAARFAAIETETFKLDPYGQYGEILARPVFNESRAPEAQADGPATEGEATGTTAAPLNVTLTGVIIMPELKLAFVRDNAANTVQRVRLGNPLEGEQNGWKLVELKPRGAVFEGEGLGRQELELSVDTTGAPAPPAAVTQIPIAGIPSPQADPAAAEAAQTEAPVQPVVPSDAAARPAGNVTPDAIRQRIEERRRQLREEAQRMMQEQQNKQ